MAKLSITKVVKTCKSNPSKFTKLFDNSITVRASASPQFFTAMPSSSFSFYLENRLIFEFCADSLMLQTPISEFCADNSSYSKYEPWNFRPHTSNIALAAHRTRRLVSARRGIRTELEDCLLTAEFNAAEFSARDQLRRFQSITRHVTSLRCRQPLYHAQRHVTRQHQCWRPAGLLQLGILSAFPFLYSCALLNMPRKMISP